MATNKQDVKYAQEMIQHHQAAVSMSAAEWVDGSDKELKDFALRVFAKQAEEIEWLKNWLKLNGTAQTSSTGAGMKM